MKLDPKSRKRMSHEETLALWMQYRGAHDRQLRNRIVLTFAPLVKYIVYNKIRELPARCEVDDFISCGLEALINSIERYDPSKGATLEQYAWTRIHGAVLDELRRQDWAPRSLRRWERDIQRARDRFATSHGRRPTTDELASAVGTTAAELRNRQDEIATSDLTSLNSLVLSDEETSVERVRPRERLGDRLVQILRDLGIELESGQRLRKRPVLLDRDAGLARRRENALGDEALPGRHHLRRAVTLVGQRRRLLAIRHR